MIYIKEHLAKVVIALIIISLLFIFGCSLLPFGKNNQVQDAQKLKRSVDTHFSKAEKTVADVSDFLKSLNKRYYTTQDITGQNGFSTKIAALLTETQNTKTELTLAKEKLNQIGQSALASNYGGYIALKTEAAVKINKVLGIDNKFLSTLEPKMATFGLLFDYVDQLNMAQNKSSNASLLSLMMQFDRSQNQSILNSITAQMAAAAQPAPTTTTSPSSTTTTTTTPSTTTTTAPTTTASTSSTESSPQWVIDILTNNFAPDLLADSLNDQHKALQSLFLNFYKIDKDLNFRNTQKAVEVIQLLKDNTLSFSSALKNMNNNLKEQRRISNQLVNIDKELYDVANQSVNFGFSSAYRTQIVSLVRSYNAQIIQLLTPKLGQTKQGYLVSLDATSAEIALARLGLTPNTINEQLLNDLASGKTPAGVSSFSAENQADNAQAADTLNQLRGLGNQIRNLSSKLNSAKTSFFSSTLDDANEAFWRYGGALVLTTRTNKQLPRGLMQEVKAWEENKIGRLILERQKLAAEVEDLNIQAEDTLHRHQQASNKTSD